MLKAEIKAELLLEMPPCRPKPWTPVRNEMYRAVEGVFQNRCDAYKIEIAINTILRFRYGLRSVTDMTEEQAEEAVSLLPDVFSLLGVEYQA